LSSIDPLAADGSGFKSSLAAVGGTQSAVVGGSNALTSKLDKMSDSVTGQTVVDPKVIMMMMMIVMMMMMMMGVMIMMMMIVVMMMMMKSMMMMMVIVAV
jgi:hypothetical protein